MSQLSDLSSCLFTKCGETTNKWLVDVGNLLDNDEKLKNLMKEIEEGVNIESCFVVRRGMCRRYKSSRKALKMVETVGSKQKDCPGRDNKRITQPLTIEDVKNIVNGYIESVTLVDLELSRKKQPARQMKSSLLDDQVDALGICGEMGLGKSGLIKKVLRKEEVRKKFANRIWVEISENPNIKDIQNKIKEKVLDTQVTPLPFEWRDGDSLEQRAKLLYFAMRLMGENKKILLVLDHVEDKVDLSKLGNLFGQNFFKTVVISINKEVCELMGVRADNLIEMTPLTTEEARCLFWSHVCHGKDKVIDQVTNYECISCGNYLLDKYCKCIPSVVTALAKVLKNKTLSQWKKFEKDVLLNNNETPTNLINLIWRESIKRLNDIKEKANFFYLTCLFPSESRIDIQELIRYAMGLDLIQHVDNITQAAELANTWVDQLISDSMLEDDDDPEGDYFKSRHVTLHHLVRESVISLLEKEYEEMIWINNIHRWVTKETLQEYSRISLMKGYDHSYLNGIESEKLQMLILDNSKPSDQFSDKFFEGMMNLKVLVLKGMKLKPCLPKSIKMLKKLRTFHLESCELENMAYIGELESLVFEEKG